MDGIPEGTERVVANWWHRRPRWQVVLVAFFAAYLMFRALQGLAWLIGEI